MIDGIRFASKGEATRYCQLKIMCDGREIADLELQPAFPIVVNDKKIATYKADFKYVDLKDNSTVVEDFKGFDTPVSKIKRKLVEAIYGQQIRIVK